MKSQLLIQRKFKLQKLFQKQVLQKQELNKKLIFKNYNLAFNLN